MEWKYAEVMLFALLLAVPAAFALSSAEALLNRVPVISGVSGPTSLQAGQTGTWTISAHDPEEGPLAYYVSWGDEPVADGGHQKIQSQTSAFTHIYYDPGAYTVRFEVIDRYGASAQSSITVNVQGKPSDVTPPTVTHTYSVTGSSVTINADAEDASGISEIQIYLSKPQESASILPDSLVKECDFSDYKVATSEGSTGSPSVAVWQGWSCSYATSLTAGSYYYYVKAKDNSENRNEKVTGKAGFGISGGPANHAPVITGITAPTNLAVGAQGTWSVGAYDPENGPLSYSVAWGDESSAGVAQPSAASQVSAFTHIYYSAGAYSPTFYVTDSAGLSAQSSSAVVVGNGGNGGDPTPKPPEACAYQDLAAVGEVGDLIPASSAACKYLATQNSDGSLSFTVDNPGDSSHPWPGAYFPIKIGKPGKYSVQLTVKGADAQSDSFQMSLLNSAGDWVQFGGYTYAGGYHMSNIADVRFEFATPVGEAFQYGTWSKIWGNHEMVYSGESRPQMSVPIVAFEVKEPGTYKLRISWRENGATLKDVRLVDANSDGTTCPQPPIPICISGYEPYSYADSKGCTIHSCREIGGGAGSGSVRVGISAQPQNARVSDSILVFGTVTFEPSAKMRPTAEEKQLKVVTSFSNSQADFAKIKANGNGRIMLKDSSDDLLEQIFSAFGQGSGGKSAPAQQAQPSGSGASSVADVAASSRASQERVDYLSLKEGESAKVSAYFTAGSPGTKFARIRVYGQKSDCPPDTDPPMGRPCSLGYALLAEASAKVKVSGEVPPPPPSNNSASGTIRLYPGWNMVSVPVNTKVQMGEVAQKCDASSFAWRLSSSGYSKETTLAPGYGYWIKSGGECAIPVSADSYSTSIADLFSGWNLVGAPGNEVSISGYSGTCSIGAGPWHYDSSPAADRASPYTYSAKLLPGQAYWIKVGASCRLGSQGEQPPAPPE